MSLSFECGNSDSHQSISYTINLITRLVVTHTMIPSPNITNLHIQLYKTCWVRSGPSFRYLQIYIVYSKWHLLSIIHTIFYMATKYHECHSSPFLRLIVYLHQIYRDNAKDFNHFCHHDFQCKSITNVGSTNQHDLC